MKELFIFIILFFISCSNTKKMIIKDCKKEQKIEHCHETDGFKTHDIIDKCFIERD